MRIRFLYPPHGNAFLRELIEAFAASAATEGVDVSVEAAPAADAGDEVIDVLIPHEYFGLDPELRWPTRRRRRRTIALITEHTGTPWFESACLAAGEVAFSLCLNRSAVVACKLRGLPVEQLQLGYLPAWDTWQGADSERPLDLVYMGISEARRNSLIASYADVLWRWRTRLLLPPPIPHPTGAPDFLVGPTKHRLLATARVVLNLHRRGTTETEWPRFMEAICNGAVMVSEHCDDSMPLTPGEHYISAAGDRLADVANALLHDPARIDRVRRSAYEFVRSALPPGRAGRMVVDTAERIVERARRPALRFFLPPQSVETFMAPMIAASRGRELPNDLGLRPLGAGGTTSRRSTRPPRAMDGGEGATPGIVEVERTAAHDSAMPKVSVILTMHNQEVEVLSSLKSLDRSDYKDYELIVVDGRSSDRTLRTVKEFLDAHPHLPAMVLASLDPHGRGWARNRAIGHARGDLLFFMDPGSTLYPVTLGRLAEALESDQDAVMVYAIATLNSPSGPKGLVGEAAWRPELLRRGENPISSVAMIRRDVMSAAGSFSEEPGLQGLEEYDLWCRLADRGWRGISLPELLGGQSINAHAAAGARAVDRRAALSSIQQRAPTDFPTTPD